MFGSLSHEARQVVLEAQEESRAHGHHFIATEHLLIGVLRAPGMAGEVLRRLGARESEVRLRLLERLGEGSLPVPRMIEFRPAAMVALEAAQRLARDDDSPGPGTVYLLRGLLEDEAIAALLTGLGLPRPRLERALTDAASAPERTGDETVDPRAPGPPIVVALGDEIIGDLGNARTDARLLLAIVLRDRGVADWLRDRGVDERAVRERFGGFDLGWDEPPAPPG